MKATLRWHTHVSRSVHRGTAATNTTLGLIFRTKARPWAKEWGSVFPTHYILDDIR